MTTFETKPMAPVFSPFSPGAEPRPAPAGGGGAAIDPDSTSVLLLSWPRSCGASV